MCREMAKGACKESGADISISVTGLAGPGGGTKETPVGTVFMGCCYEGRTIAKEFHFTGNRMRIASRLQRMHWRCYVTVSLWANSECLYRPGVTDQH